MIIAETNRLILRIWGYEDIKDYAQIISDPEVMKFIGNGLAQNLQEAELYITKCIEVFAENGWSRFAVINKETNKLMGFCGFANYNNELDFGWRFAKKFWGKGYGTEAAKVVLELGIKTYKFQRIVCIVYPENKASIRIIEKIGMKFEKQILLNKRKVNQYVKLNTIKVP